MVSNPENELIIKARLAEQAERYDEMCEFVKELVNTTKLPLGVEERNLLSVAFKNSIGARRASLRVLTSFKIRAKDRGNENDRKIIEEYIANVSTELLNISQEIIDLLNNKLLQDESKLEPDALVFYLKMKGDYYRYLCEFTTDKTREQYINSADKAYKAANAVAEEKLAVTSPVRLGLALNYSVFHYEIMNNSQKACALAKNAFDNAINQLETVEEDVYRDSTLIMQLLRDNLTLWTNDRAPSVQRANENN